jgi:aryl-alcohol dehydrogenase-like predicted oxidoreductase
MEYRTLGRSGLKVSTMTMGTMTFGGKGGFAQLGDTDVEGATRQIDLCVEHGVNLVDTADMYSAGTSEEIVGQATKNHRDDLLLATKCRFPMGSQGKDPGPNDGGASRQHIVRSCEDSLRRLGVEHIDLYQLHGWDGVTPLEETLEALDTLVRKGKIRYIGCSNYSAWHIMKALGVSERGGYQRFASQQIHYTLQAREAENELVPVSIDQGLGILVWSPIAGGLLSGKFRRGQDSPETSRHLTEWSEPPVHDRERLYDIVEVAAEIGDAHGVSVAQVANAWLLHQPGVTSLVIGARTEEQLADNLAAAELALSDDELARLDEVSATPLLYPYWHQQKTITDRLSPADAALLT